ncbi:hypothetical protein [Streptacidiphilus sp. EB129]|uniref:hypothetical protein n=1 Tax=Streptacidiphilus sp. EB129 TaxID=3156262 RepID=UPI00351489C3
MTRAFPSTVDVTRPALTLRLRPIVHACPIRDGIHVRGARSSFTMNGSSGLWRLWQLISLALADGRSHQGLLELAPNPTVRAAIETLAQQLHDHDMLVEIPPGWGESLGPDDPPARIAGWLAAVAPDPLDAWERLRCAAVVVGEDGPVAAAAARALTGAGVRVLRPRELLGAPAEAGSGMGGLTAHPMNVPVVLSANEVAVAVAAVGDVGLVTPTGTTESARRDAEALAERIGLPAGPPAPAVLAALVGGAAAHRLVCAIAGLPDPGADIFAPAARRSAPTASAATASAATVTPAAAAAGASTPPGHPTALIARLDPLRAAYHPWPASAGTVLPPGGEPADLDTALTRVEMLGDPETGVLPPVDLDDLPQLPTGLAQYAVGDVVLYGIGTDSRRARLAAALGAVERLLGLNGEAGAVVGADTRHAEGVLLRRLVRLRCPHLAATELDEAEWARSPEARRWFKAVTLRFGVQADLRLRRLATGLYHAEMSTGAEQLGWAVESTAADAAAFCALTAAGVLQWRAAGGDPTAIAHALCGAFPLPASEEPDPSTTSDGRTWLAATYQREDGLQQRMRILLGIDAPPTVPLEPNSRLTRALAAAGLVSVGVAP